MPPRQLVRLETPKFPDEQGLYWDPSANDGAGARITTNSMIKTMRRCPKQAEYKYVHRLKPRRLGAPLKRGTWWHALLEADGKGEDWKKVHAHYTSQFSELFDEEKDYYGDMPREIETMMRSYQWHYANDPWEYVDNEFQLEAKFPDGTVYRGKVDALVRNAFGLWLVDHKSHKTLPNFQYRLQDTQAALYTWAAWENGLEVNGFIWNYARWKVPSTPAILKSGDRFSQAKIDTDYPTFARAVKKAKETIPGFQFTQRDIQLLRTLKSHRYEFGKAQSSDYFRREVFEHDPDMVERVVKEAYRTSNRLHNYDFSDRESVERVPDRSCSFSCSFQDICSAELIGGNVRPVLNSGYVNGDPNDYYSDRAGDSEKEDNQ